MNDETTTMKQTIKRDEAGTAYVTEAGGKTRVYAIEAPNYEGWYLERQKSGGDESPERLSWHDTETEAMTELVRYQPQRGEQ